MEEIPSILNVAEVEFYVQSLKPSEIKEIGSAKWFEEHQRLERLRQQCVVEVTYNVEERVKDIILTSEKLPILVHEVICIQLWRQKVWKKIVKNSDKKMLNGFIGYMILYHECTAVNFLQILFHHKETIQCMGDEALDLIDYCVMQVISLMSEKNKPTAKSDEEDELKRLKSQECEMGFNNGLASIAILASISEYVGELSISAVVRMYETHDVPVIMASMMDKQPWKRRDDEGEWEAFNEGKWHRWDTEELCKAEAQCWISLRGLLLHPKAKEHYEMTNHRRQTLMKLQKYLHESVVDQMAPLVELKQLLGHLGIKSETSSTKPPLILETMALIREGLLCQGSKWRNLLDWHTSLMFNENQRENATGIAKCVAETYDADFLDCLNRSGKPPSDTCRRCAKMATKKCSQCKTVWYCSRKCQVLDWSDHKSSCVKQTQLQSKNFM